MIGRRGIASLLVLWAMLLLGTLALAFSLSMRTEGQAARNGLDRVDARLAPDVYARLLGESPHFPVEFRRVERTAIFDGDATEIKIAPDFRVLVRLRHFVDGEPEITAVTLGFS